jgi:hypothetical protein
MLLLLKTFVFLLGRLLTAEHFSDSALKGETFELKDSAVQFQTQ